MCMCVCMYVCEQGGKKDGMAGRESEKNMEEGGAKSVPCSARMFR